MVKLAFAGSLVLLCLFATLVFLASCTPDTTVRIGNAIVEEGTNATFPIMIENVGNLGSAKVNLTFNESVVNVTNVLDSEFEIPPNNYTQGQGWVLLEGGQVLNGLEGRVRLCKVTLQAVNKEGSMSPLNLTDIALENMQMENINAPKVENGTFETTPKPTIWIGNATVEEGSNATVPIMIENVSNLGSAKVNLTFNELVVKVANVLDSDFEIPPNLYTRGLGWVLLEGGQYWKGLTEGKVRLCNVTLQAVNKRGSKSELTLLTVELEDTHLQTVNTRGSKSELTLSTVELEDTQMNKIKDPKVKNGIFKTTPKQTPVIPRGGGGGASRDSDGDGYSDGYEMAAGTDPHDPNSYPGAPTPVLTPAPTLTPKPTPTKTASELIKEELKKLATGRVLFSVPKKMRVGEKERVVVRITKNITENLTEGLKPNGSQTVEKIKVHTCMKVRLTGDNFYIKPLCHEEQVVGPEGFTPWTWDVTPLKSGNLVLHLLVTVRIKIPDYSDEKIDQPVLDRYIDVDANLGHSIKGFIGSYWERLVGLVTIIILIIGIIIKYRGGRSRKKKVVQVKIK